MEAIVPALAHLVARSKYISLAGDLYDREGGADGGAGRGCIEKLGNQCPTPF